MRCAKSKPIFGMFHLVCGILIVSVALGIDAISSVEAVTQIGAGDRIFFVGNQWVRNRTAAQTGFEVIRLSSYVPVSRMRYVTDTLNLKLMIGLAHNVTPVETTWPGDQMNDHPRIFRDSLANWLGQDGLDISAFHFNLEFPEEDYIARKIHKI